MKRTCSVIFGFIGREEVSAILRRLPYSAALLRISDHFCGITVACCRKTQGMNPRLFVHRQMLMCFSYFGWRYWTCTFGSGDDVRRVAATARQAGAAGRNRSNRNVPSPSWTVLRSKAGSNWADRSDCWTEWKDGRIPIQQSSNRRPQWSGSQT